MQRDPQSRSEAGRPRRARRWLAACVVGLMLAIASPVAADDYDSRDAGHPVRIVAYVLYPIGFILDYLILRPAHWIASQGPMKQVFGHED